MQPFRTHTARGAPLDRANVATDQIIPKQFLKSIHRSGFGPNLFDEWRYLDRGQPGMGNARRPLNPDFVLNQARYKGAAILRLWVEPRARTVGDRRVRVPRGDCAEFCRYLLQQLLQERLAADRTR